MILTDPRDFTHQPVELIPEQIMILTTLTDIKYRPIFEKYLPLNHPLLLLIKNFRQKKVKTANQFEIILRNHNPHRFKPDSIDRCTI